MCRESIDLKLNVLSLTTESRWGSYIFLAALKDFITQSFDTPFVKTMWKIQELEAQGYEHVALWRLSEWISKSASHLSAKKPTGQP